MDNEETNGVAEEDRLIGIVEASKILGIHKDTLRRWERQGRITPIRFTSARNARRKYRVSDIEAIKHGQKVL